MICEDETYFPTHAWTTEFFGSLYRDSEFLPLSSRLFFLIGTLCKQASGYGSNEELWPVLPSCMFQGPHHPLCSSCHPDGWRSLWLLFNWRLGQAILKKEFIGPGLHLRPVCADRAWPPLQWTLNSVLSTYGNDNGRIRPPSGQGNLEEEKTDTNHPCLRTVFIEM